MLRVAAAQIYPEFANKKANLDKILDFTKRAAKERAQLVVFPECALTGYCFAVREPGYANSEPIPGPSTERVIQLARRDDLYVSFGLLERVGEKFFNAQALVGPEGVVSVHRKAHLPFLGVDRYVTPGDIPLRAASTKIGKIGTLICFECSLPEPSRALKLSGAQLILIPTNWPVGGAETSCDHVPIVRALENHVNVMAVNRIGKESEFDFLGQSSIVDYSAKVLARADRTETLLLAEIDMAGADKNRVVIRPGEYELDRLSTRRPDLY
jgi:predicted amidohydrolase